MKILIIESDAPFAERLAGALAARGVDTELTPDGKDGLDRAHQDRPDAIVLAVELGDKLTGGYAYCNKLKKDDALRSVPLVLVSSQATPETFEQHRKLKTRAEAYLIKPFEPAELIDALSQHVELPPPDIEIDDLGDEGVPVEEMETFELSSASDGGGGGGDDVFGLDAAFGNLADGDATSTMELPDGDPPGETPGMDSTGVGEDEFRLDELPGEASLPPPVRVSPGPARAMSFERPPPSAPARANPNLTPGPAAAAAETALQIADLKGHIAELEVRLETALRDLEELRQSDDDRLQRLEAELARKDAGVKAAQQRADAAQAQLRKLEATADALRGDAGRMAALEEDLARVTQERDSASGRVQELERELRDVRVNADTEGDRLRARVAELESDAARNEDRVIKAYQRIKGDEKVKEKTKKALAIALQLLDEHAAESDEVHTS